MNVCTQDVVKISSENSWKTLPEPIARPVANSELLTQSNDSEKFFFTWYVDVTVTGKHSRANSPVRGPSHVLSQPEQINQLIEMFPDSTREDISTSLAVHGTVARAGSTTLTNDKDDSDSDLAELVLPPRDSDYKPVSLSGLLEDLTDIISNDREKLKVDEEDLLNDAMAYYKDETFDPKKKLRIIYIEQPAADTGGVTRHFFNQLLHLLSVEFFYGDDYKIPIYNSRVVASGMMTLVGKIIVHSILQGGPGLTIFSPFVYHYLATGNVDEAIQRMTINDCSLRIKSYINMVSAFKVLLLGQAFIIDQAMSTCHRNLRLIWL